jgi:hypothetical protein
VVEVDADPYYFIPNSQPANEIVTDKGWRMKRVGHSELGGRGKIYVAGRDNKNQLKVFIDGIHSQQLQEQISYNQGVTPRASEVIIEQQPAEGGDWEEIDVNLDPSIDPENAYIDEHAS